MFAKYRFNSLFKISSLMLIVVVLFATNIQAQYTVGTPSAATGTINDDDTATFTVNEVSVAEDVSGGMATVTVSVDNAIDITTTVNVAFTSGTATAGSDFTAATATVTFNAGTTTAQMASVAITNDGLVEPDENINVTLSMMTNVGTRTVDVTDTGMVTITSEDVGTLSIAQTADGAEPSTDGTFTVTTSNQFSTPVVYNVTIGGTATNGTDYAMIPATATFPANMATATITVDVTDDMLVEMTETVTATLAAGTGYAVTSTANNMASLDISDDDEGVISIAATTQAAEDATDGLFTLTTTKQFASSVNVSITVAGTATNGTDYAMINNMVTFPANASTTTIPLDVSADAVVEGTESVIITVNNGTGYTPSGTPNNEATVNITDNDNAAVTVADVTVTEGTDMSFTVTLDNAVQGGTTVDVTLTDGTATGGNPLGNNDYDNVVAQLTFTGTVGETQQFTVSTNNDNTVELAAEDFTVSLDAGNANVTDTDMATGTINDNDMATFTINDVTEDEAGPLDFTVSLDNPIDINVTVNVNFTDGPATNAQGGTTGIGAGDDYNNSQVQVTFNAGTTTSLTASVPLFDDTNAEGNENFTAALTLQTTTGTRSITHSDTGQGTIDDNDCPCDPTCSTLPTAPGTYTATIANTVPGSGTFYCDNSNNLLLAADPAMGIIPAGAVSLKINNPTQTVVLTQYCGGNPFFGGCMVSHPSGAVLLNRQWEIDGSFAGVTASGNTKITYYYTNAEFMQIQTDSPVAIPAKTDMQIYDVKNTSHGVFPMPANISLFSINVVRDNGNNNVSITEWNTGAYSGPTVGGNASEFEVLNLNGGGAIGGKIAQ